MTARSLYESFTTRLTSRSPNSTKQTTAPASSSSTNGSDRDDVEDPSKKDLRRTEPSIKLLVAVFVLVFLSARMLFKHGGRILSIFSFFSSDDAADTPFAVNDFQKDEPCVAVGTSMIVRPAILEKSKVKKLDKKRLESLRHLTEETSYARRMVNKAGTEHYRLLQYMTQHFGDCRHVTEVGTGVVASALALGATGTHVRSFDTPRADRSGAYRGRTEEEWYSDLVAAGVEIEFFNVNLLRMPLAEFERHFGTTWLVYLDTAKHLPYSKPFEREFFQRLMAIRFSGFLMIDDIHGPGTFGGETERWWYELIDHEEEKGYKCHDLTEVGHFSGTGLVDFSGGLFKYINK